MPVRFEKCSVATCAKLVHCKGMCQAHYRNQRKYGNPYGTLNPKKPGPQPDPSRPHSRYNPGKDTLAPGRSDIPAQCHRGHALNEETLRYNTKGARYCGVCAAENSQRSRKAADPAYGTRRDKYAPERLAVQPSFCKNGHTVSAEDVKTYSNGHRRCRFCVSDSTAKQRFRKYGITLEHYQSVLETQGGVCAVCQHEFGGPRDEHIDHDHITGQVRGILCSQCNTAIGKFKDSPEIIIRAAEYIMRSWDKSSA